MGERRTRKLLSSLRPVRGGDPRVAEATRALLAEAVALLRAYGVEVDQSTPPGSLRSRRDLGQGEAVEFSLTWAPSERGLWGSLWRGGVDDAEAGSKNVLVCGLVYDPVINQLLATDQPDTSPLDALIEGILRLLGHPALAARPDAPIDTGAQELLLSALGKRAGRPGEAEALARLLAIAVSMLGAFDVNVRFPDSAYDRWGVSRSPVSGTAWNLSISPPNSARRVMGVITETRDGHATGPTREIVLAELVYDPASGTLLARDRTRGSALEALLRGVLGALGWAVG